MGVNASYITLYASLVDNLINVVCRDSGLQFASSEIQNLTSQSANLTHAFLLLLVQDSNIMAANELLLGTRDTIAGVVRVRDRLGNGSLGGERVDGSQGTAVREGRVRVIVAGSWIWFRNYLRREKVGEDITLFVGGLVFSLEAISQWFLSQKGATHVTLV
jgi:hypothetical protein